MEGHFIRHGTGDLFRNSWDLQKIKTKAPVQVAPALSSKEGIPEGYFVTSAVMPMCLLSIGITSFIPKWVLLDCSEHEWYCSSRVTPCQANFE